MFLKIIICVWVCMRERQAETERRERGGGGMPHVWTCQPRPEVAEASEAGIREGCEELYVGAEFRL